MLKPLLLVEDDAAVRSTVVTFLELEGYTVDAVASTRDAIKMLGAKAYPIIVSDIYIDERTGLDVLDAAKRANAQCAVVLMSGRGSIETVMKATRGGAFDYIAKPFELDELLEILKRAEATLVTSEDEDADDIDDLPETEMIGFSPIMVDLYKTISRVAPTDATVLIEGETGTGKELIAKMIHQHSLRATQAFQPVDCASIAPTLLESELFGAVRGAYTGADRDRGGVFEAANRGTVFLDEIGEIDMGFQAKLLRFLQERQVRPLGSQKAHTVDVRVVSATNRNIAKMVEDGKFREDLFYRLNGIPLRVPPLRERSGDVPVLAQHFLKRYNGRYTLATKLTDSGTRELQNFTWPGNVRQLQHLLERLTILAPQGRIDSDAVREAIAATEARDNSGETLAGTEAEQIRRVMAAANGNKSRAARILGIERKTLYRKLERLGLEQ